MITHLCTPHTATSYWDQSDNPFVYISHCDIPSWWYPTCVHLTLRHYIEIRVITHLCTSHTATSHHSDIHMCTSHTATLYWDQSDNPFVCISYCDEIIVIYKCVYLTLWHPIEMTAISTCVYITLCHPWHQINLSKNELADIWKWFKCTWHRRFNVYHRDYHYSPWPRISHSATVLPEYSPTATFFKLWYVQDIYWDVTRKK